MFGAAAVASSSKGVSQIANSLNLSLTGEKFWQSVREQFAFNESVIPMNAANLCPSFKAVTDSVTRYTADIDRDCSFNNRAKFYELLEQSRRLVANQLNVSSGEVALVRNTSEANNIISNGLQLESGDEVLIWDQNHPTNNVGWEVRAARFDFSVKKVATPQKPLSTDELVQAFTAQFSSKTKVLILTHVSNISGIKLPLAEIITAAHERGIYVHVDGAQVWGAMALDLTALGVDSFSASAHKWYMGPKEVGLLYVKKSNIERIWPNIIGADWGNGADTSLPGARKFESLGQRDDAAIAALGVAAEIHNTIGPKRIENRIVALAQRLKSGMDAAGLKLVSPLDPELSFGVCIAEIPEAKTTNDSYIASAGKSVSVYKRLYSDYGISGAPVNGIRLCPTIYNTEEHIDRAVEGLTALLV